MPLVSVIVPVYNTEQYLQRCIDSILAQTFKDFELILVDDGSPDNCGAICDEYSARYDFIFSIHKENGGVSAARNDGVGRATGKYVTFIDPDDWIDRFYLERLYRACEDNDADIAVGSSERIFCEKEATTPDEEGTVVRNRYEALNIYGMHGGADIRSSWAKLIKREIVCKELFPMGRVMAEDAACVYRWYWQATKIVEVRGARYYYFQNAGSICHSAYGWHNIDYFRTYDEMLQFYEDKGLYKLLEQNIGDYLYCLCSDYETCIRQNKSEIASFIQTIIHRVLDKWLNYRNVGIVETREGMISVLEKAGAQNIMRNYVSHCAKALAEQCMKEYINDRKYAAILRKRLKRMVRTYYFEIIEFSIVYEAIYPRGMQLYWIMQAQISKLRKKTKVLQDKLI